MARAPKNDLQDFVFPRGSAGVLDPDGPVAPGPGEVDPAALAAMDRTYRDRTAAAELKPDPAVMAALVPQIAREQAARVAEEVTRRKWPTWIP